MAKREAEKQVWDWGKSVERTQKENCLAFLHPPGLKPYLLKGKWSKRANN